MKSNKSKIVWGLVWKFAERISAQAISLIVSIVLARLLSPNEYGAVALVMVFITLANVFVTNGLGSSLIQKKNADNIDFSSVFFANIALSLILYAIIFFVAPVIAVYYELPVLKPALRVLGIRIVIAAINSVQQAYVSKKMLFKRFFWSTLAGTAISAIVGIAMAYNGFGVWALVAQYLVNTTVDTLVLWFTVRWRPEFAFSLARTKGLLRFGWKILVSALIDSGYKQIRSLVIGKVYSEADLAYYNNGDKYPSLLVTNIIASISSVLYPALSNEQDDMFRIKQMTRRAIKITAFLMWPLMVGLAVCAEAFVKVILTDKWLPCVPYIRIFCFSYALWPIHTANLQALNAMGRSDLFLKLEIIKKTLGLVLLIFSLRISPMAIAISLIVSDVVSVFVNAYPNTKILKYSFKEQLSDLLRPMLVSIVMGGCIFPVVYLEIRPILVLLLQIIIGAVCYFLLSIIFQKESSRYIFDMLKRRNK